MNELASTIIWHPVDGEEKPEEFERVLIAVDRWSSVVDDWLHNDIQISVWHPSLNAFDFSLNGWSEEHKPKIKYWAHMPEV